MLHLARKNSVWVGLFYKDWHNFLIQGRLYSFAAIGILSLIWRNAAVVINFNNSVYWMDEPRGDIMFDIKLRM